jgi:DnaJ-class molecular chaperone
MVSEDLYAVLGVQPDAEDIVIIAAYRALAQRYHPDRWAGDSTEAHRRMSQINAAYEILGNKSRRAEYDRSWQTSNHAEFSSNEDAGQTEAFDTALKDTEEKWTIANSIYNDLNQHRQRLARFSTSLAFSFVVVILESKAYKNRLKIAQQMERKFIERYFGTNDTIVKYASQLIVSGHKQAAKALNRLVEVMGSDLDPKLLIKRINDDFGEPIRNRDIRDYEYCPDCQKYNVYFDGIGEYFCPNCEKNVKKL